MKSKSLRQNIYSPTDASFAFILALIVPQILFVVVMAIIGKENASNTIVIALIPQISFLITFFFISERKKVNYKQANQINFKINIWALLVVILIGVVAIFGFSFLINLFDYITSQWGYKGSTSNIDVSTFGKFFGTIFYVALLPAVCEELIFRGVITNGFKKYGTVTAVVLSAIFFALMHQNLQQLIYQLFLGAVMAYIAIKTGSILYTMILHFFNNFIILLLAHLSGDSGVTDFTDPKIIEYYSNVWNVIWPILLSLLAVGVIVGLLFLLNFIIKKSKQKEEILQTNQTVFKTDALDQSNQNELKTNLEKQEEQITTNDNTINSNVNSMFSNFDEKQKFYQNPIVICAFVAGLIFWILTVISSFGK